MDLYVILGLDRAASTGDIKRAYKRLARRYHPDINPGDRAAAAHFRAIAEAYETLSDPERRSRYDRGADAGSPGGAATFGFEGFDFSVTVGGASAPTFGDLFADVLHQREVRQRDEATRGVDLHDAITLSFEDAVRGGQRQITVTRQEHCRTCRGTGRLNTAESRCTYCQGSGTVMSARGHMVFSKPCAYCGGSGRQRETL